MRVPSDKRQRAAIEGFANRAGFEIVDEFYDPGVSGADPIQGRKGFAQLLDRVENNGPAFLPASVSGSASR